MKFNRRTVLRVIILVLFAATAMLQHQFLAVGAEITDNLVVTPPAIDLDMVFPGEYRDYDFHVALTDFFQRLQPFTTVFYTVAELNPADGLGLCDFMTQGPDQGEGENDSAIVARLSKAQGDISDHWQGALGVPAIAGFVGQFNPTGVTPAAGEHECNLTVMVTGTSSSPISSSRIRTPRQPRTPEFPWRVICRAFPQLNQCSEEGL